MSTALNASYIEYYKDYGAPKEVVRVSLQFEKPSVLHPKPLLQNAVITRQMLVALHNPSEFDVPPLIRSELEDVHRVCAPWMAIADQAVARKTCSRCGSQTAEFIDLKASVYCIPCMDALEGAT